MKKVKNEIKRAFRLPGNAAVMTMMAVILVCAAPALVSVIDDSITYEYTSDIVLLEVPSEKASYAKTSESQLSVSQISASDNNGVHFVAIDNQSLASAVTYIRFYGIDMDPLTNGATSLTIVTEAAPNAIYFGASSNGSSVIWKPFEQTTTDPAVWTYELSSVDRARFASDNIDYIYIDFQGALGAADMKISAGGSQSLAYGEIIIGATGALLLVCAILATPWVSTSGLTVKRRR